MYQKIKYRARIGMEGGAELRREQTLQAGAILDNHCRALYLQELVFFEIREYARDGLPGSANDLGNLLVRERQFELSFFFSATGLRG